MKESIHIQNFGPLRDVRIDDIKPLTVLIGDSASGKSTLMKVIAFMRYMYKKGNVRAYLKKANIDAPIRSQPFFKDELEPMVSLDTEIAYTVHMDSGLMYTVEYNPNENRLTVDYNTGNEDLVFFKESYVSETRSIIPLWSLRGARFPGTNLGYYFNETFRGFSEATDRIKEQALDYIGMKMEVKTEPTRKHFLISSKDGSNKYFELENTSSGIQTSAPLMTIVRYFAHEFSFTNAFRRSVLDQLSDEDISQFRPEINLKDLKKYIHLYIEEPELSLDPKTQCLFINDLIREAFYRGDNKRPDDGRQLGLMFATHSPYILNHLNVLLKASYYEKARKQDPYIEPGEIAVYQLHDGEVHSLVEDDEETRERIIDTYKFSETMEWILDKYESVD
jgi:hypothetical protein BACCOPRO_01415